MNIIGIIAVILFLLIILDGLRKSIKMSRNSSQNPGSSRPFMPYYGFWQGHPLGTTTMQPGDLTRIEEKLRGEAEEKEEEEKEV